MKKDILFAGMNERELAGRKKATEPDFIEPMLATLTTNYFSSTDWIYEHKFDGERCIAVKKKGKVRLLSHNRKEINTGYPELVRALEKQAADNFIIDGEIVALKKGLSDFELLQSRINLQNEATVAQRVRAVPVYYHIFDVMYTDGYDVRNLPLLERKQILKKLLRFTEPLLYTEHRSPDGLQYYKQACKSHWEGLIAKRAQSAYVSVRSRDWLKFKCVMKQELVVGGFTQPQGSRSDFGALLVGYYDKGAFIYAGRVGTGFSYETLALLGKKLRALEIARCPFSDFNQSAHAIHWVKPRLVIEVQFAEWTNAGRLRVGRYKGLRDDKAPRDVVKEVPAK